MPSELQAASASRSDYKSSYDIRILLLYEDVPA
jgi:hypothetical protein